jgi:hypothetical protein
MPSVTAATINTVSAVSVPMVSLRERNAMTGMNTDYLLQDSSRVAQAKDIAPMGYPRAVLCDLPEFFPKLQLR